MEEFERLERDFREGRIDAARAAEMFARLLRLFHEARGKLEEQQRKLEEQQRKLEEQQRRCEEQQRRIEELEKQIPGGGPPKLSEPYSMRAEEQREQKKLKKRRKPKRKKRRGRTTTEEKLRLAERREKAFPVGVPEHQCKWSHARVVWRFEFGRAVLIGYDVYRGPKGEYPHIPGTIGRSEFSVEIFVVIAYYVYVLGLSFDKVCEMLRFFQGLRVSKSQVDALLRQLSRHWQSQFDVLCTLAANSMVVHADETGWSIKSVWAFLSEQARLVLFGVSKDGATLKTILDPEQFGGVVISDDAAVYANFTHAQKCWAHLLRKAIRLTLQAPKDERYRRFLDELLLIYRDARRIQRDKRLGDAGRRRRVAALDDRILELCAFADDGEPANADELEHAYYLLANELNRLMINQELFTFVTTAAPTAPNGATEPVAGTNNEAERTLRSPALARKTGRTNKTAFGARRQTILVSVLESLRKFLPAFNLDQVLDEVKKWTEGGRSCFERLLRKLKLKPPDQSVLDRLFPAPSG